MALVDALIVVGIFAILGFAIASKMRNKNPQKFDRSVKWIKDMGRDAKQTITKQNVPIQPTKLPEDSRIM